MYWGFQVPDLNAGKDSGGIDNSLAGIEKSVGLHSSIIGAYQSAMANGVYSKFDPTGLNTIVAHGSVPMMTWQLRDSKVSSKAQPNWSCDAITSGSQDAYLKGWCAALAAWGKTCFVRFMHEMDGDWYPWGVKGGINGNTPAKHAAAFRYVANLLPSNAIKVWCPDSLSPYLDDMSALGYPGNDVIDWLSCDSYNFGDDGAHGWRTAAKMFDYTMSRFATIAPNKPVIIAETACDEAPSLGDKAAWITDLGTTLLKYPNLKAFLWMWDSPNSRENRLVTPAAQAAFRAAVTGSGYNSGYISVNGVLRPVLAV